MDEVRIPPAGDSFYAAGCAKLRRTHEECIAAMHAEEERLGRKMSDREREAFSFPRLAGTIDIGRRRSPMD